MLTPEQLDQFQRFGIVRIPGAISLKVAATMCESVWAMMARRYKIRRDDPETWKAQRVVGTRDRPKSIIFEQIANSSIRAIFDQLLGREGWERDDHWGSLLVSFPGSYPETRGEKWDVPHQGWHFDAPVVRSLPRPYGLRVFTCLEKVAPQGGPTLVVAGSPLLTHALADARSVNRIRSADLRKGLMQRYDWIKELCSFDASVDREQRFMKSSATLDDVEVRVVEMTGEPGDVYLMHPVMMHSASSNCLAVPRMVLSTTVYRRGVDWSALYSPDREAA